ncbi:hypothetical protein [Sorangium cellulosum]|uniref:hypothetical protein n=1 Tax=Sorangium cellulosum TaxID=56 RepID=UPI000AB684CE|nr:hypothetical protein [Sorangium cellulosum]
MRHGAILGAAWKLICIAVASAACDPVVRSFDGEAASTGGPAEPEGECGDGRVDPGEVCEDGNTTDGDGCDSNCTPTGCGNGVVSEAEGCDDGNTRDGDGCDSNCTLTGCGNGVVTRGETCDDGNTRDGDGCDSNCTPTGCGNGVTTKAEACDDDNREDGDGCDSNCTTTACGNGIVTTGELCDGEERCREDCKALVYLPTDVRGIRKFAGGEPFLLGFLAIKSGTEDRTVAEFSLGELPPTSTSVQLSIDLQNIDEGGTEGSIDVYWYSADGVVNPDDFNAGEHYSRLPASASFQTVSVDVSSLVATLRMGFSSLGVRLSTATADRYNLDQQNAQPPRLEVLSR